MYTVKQVATLTGVAEATLRVWERRYAVVSPSRTPGGYRLYDDNQVEALREMASLVEAGVPASRAADTVRGLPGSGVVGAPSTLADADADGGSVERPAADELVSAAASLEPVRLTEVLRRAFASGSFEDVADGWLLPSLVRIGEAWEAGELSVAQEHFASAGLMRAISATFDAAPVAATGPTVLVGLPPGDRHQIALLTFATCLRRRGVNVVYLGSDIPVDEWVRAADGRRARAAVIGVTSERFVERAQAVVDGLAQVSPPLSVWVGGSHCGSIAGVHHLPGAVAEAASILHVSLASGRL
ncbi:MerR family transcriptional regulator [Tessaracoccus sp. G1721]